MGFKANFAQLLAIIKNGYKADKKHVTCRWSTNIMNLLLFLLEKGYINGFSVKTTPSQVVDIYLKYSRFGSPIAFYFNHIQLKPAFCYISLKQLRRYYYHSYVCVVSTNIGLLSGDKAVFLKRGGLYLFKL